jgi:outer membrane protein OmpA-like peptidoglycan-associated protein
MKGIRIAFALLVTLTLVAVFTPNATAEGESITITIDRNVMPQTIFHPGRSRTEPATVTVYDYVIRDYSGKPTKVFTLQTASGRTRVPLESVREITLDNWISRRTDDIPDVEHVVHVDMLLKDGTRIDSLMNADFGTIEGTVDNGEFFLEDPHTVRHIVFNESMEAPPVVVTPVEGPLDSDGDGVPDSLDKCPNTPAGVAVDENGCPPDSDADGVADYMDECPDTPREAPVNSVGCWTLKGINFDYNKWDIKPQYDGLLAQHIRVLEMNPAFKIEIQGHTDSIASEEYNQMLSEKRAESTKDYFVSHGIDAARISTRGFGELRPIAPNDTPEGRAENRRIEVKILSR